MTNRPNDPKQFPDASETDTEAEPILEPQSEPQDRDELPHDITATDLRLTPGKKQHRHEIGIPEEEMFFIPTAAPSASERRKAHRKKKRRKLWKKILLGVLLALLLIVVAAAITFFVLYHQGRGEMLSTEGMVLTLPDVLIDRNDATLGDGGRTVVYKGETYRFNEDRTNILCLGMDKTDMGLDSGVIGTAGQADTIVLLSIDTATGRCDALAISRDTMVDINLHAEDGSFYGSERTQICKAYAYGDGFHTSCDNMVKSVNRLLYGVPINTYFTINLSAISTLNDAVGGVTVTLLEDFKASYGWYPKGTSFTLWGKDAERYIRGRDTSLLDSNNDRMERQKQYISAFFHKALQATSENLQVPLDLFNTVSSDTVTNLSPSKITFLATSLVQHHSDILFHTMPGTVTEGADGKAEYVVNEEALYELILEIFFTKV